MNIAFLLEVVAAIANALLVTSALLLTVPAVVLLIQLTTAWPIRRQKLDGALSDDRSSEVDRARLAVLMPAHNEAAGIAVAIDAVKCQLRPGDRLLVVADNCHDDTAEVAVNAGAQVARRSDVQRRGKGYALDFGVRWLAADPPEVLIVIDADCKVHPGTLNSLAWACMTHQRPIQALYLMRSTPGASLKTRIAEFAWTVKNHARALGNQRLGMPCQLMGSGMAFTWSQVSQAPLASGHLVEDLQLGLHMAAIGKPPYFCPDAFVTSFFPVSEDGLAAQRTRWEHGYLSVMFTHGPQLLCQAVLKGRVAPLFVAVDLCVPPIASLLLMQIGSLLCCALFMALSGYVLPLAIAILALAATMFALGLGWTRFGRHIISLKDLIGIPAYVVGKIPMYLSALRRRQVEWIRTRRDDDSA